MAAALRDAGAEPLELPTDPHRAAAATQRALRAHVQRLRDYDWVIFTSANGVEPSSQALARGRRATRAARRRQASPRSAPPRARRCAQHGVSRRRGARTSIRGEAVAEAHPARERRAGRAQRVLLAARRGRARRAARAAARGRRERRRGARLPHAAGRPRALRRRSASCSSAAQHRHRRRSPRRPPSSAWSRRSATDAERAARASPRSPRSGRSPPPRSQRLGLPGRGRRVVHRGRAGGRAGRARTQSRRLPPTQPVSEHDRARPAARALRGRSRADQRALALVARRRCAAVRAVRVVRCCSASVSRAGVSDRRCSASHVAGLAGPGAARGAAPARSGPRRIICPSTARAWCWRNRPSLDAWCASRTWRDIEVDEERLDSRCSCATGAACASSRATRGLKSTNSCTPYGATPGASPEALTSGRADRAQRGRARPVRPCNAAAGEVN